MQQTGWLFAESGSYSNICPNKWLNSLLVPDSKLFYHSFSETHRFNASHPFMYTILNNPNTIFVGRFKPTTDQTYTEMPITASPVDDTTNISQHEETSGDHDVRISHETTTGYPNFGRWEERVTPINDVSFRMTRPPVQTTTYRAIRHHPRYRPYATTTKTPPTTRPYETSSNSISQNNPARDHYSTWNQSPPQNSRFVVSSFCTSSGCSVLTYTENVERNHGNQRSTE